jgi:hypothetical protein
MRRTVLLASAILAWTSGAFGQSEEMTIEQIPRPGGRVMFVAKPTSNDVQCTTLDAGATTPSIATRLGRTILAEALIYNSNAVGYVYLISYGIGPYEVYFSRYTKRACVLTESQSSKRAFIGDNRFHEAKLYYHDLFNQLSE